MAQRVPFLVAELGPDVPPFLLHILASVAEQERAADLRADAGRPGGRQGARRPAGQSQAQRARAPMLAAKKARADAFAAEVAPIIREAQGVGAATLQSVADALNARGIATSQGKRWQPATVKNALKRSRMIDIARGAGAH